MKIQCLNSTSDKEGCKMSSFQNQTISSTNNTVNLIVDDPLTSIDEGRPFVFVSGIGGNSLRDAESGLENNLW